MGKLTATIVTALLLLGSIAELRAQQTPAPGPAPRSPEERRDGREVWQNREGLMEAKRLVGTKVRTADGRDLGEIDELMIDPKSGRVSQVVIGLGGFAGIGERKVVVPWSSVKMARDSGDRQAMVASIDQATLDKAPRFEGTDRGDRDRPPAASPGGGREDTGRDRSRDRERMR